MTLLGRFRLVAVATLFVVSVMAISTGPATPVFATPGCPTIAAGGHVSGPPEVFTVPVNWAGCDLRGANLDWTGIAEPSYFSGANLAGADLTGAHFNGQDFTGTDLSSAKLDHASGWCIEWTNNDIYPLPRCTSFSGANLTDATLKGAEFGPGWPSSCWPCAPVGGVGFAGANLTNADFTGGTVEGDLTGANVTGTKFAGAFMGPQQVGYSYYDSLYASSLVGVPASLPTGWHGCYFAHATITCPGGFPQNLKVLSNLGGRVKIGWDRPFSGGLPITAYQIGLSSGADFADSKIKWWRIWGKATTAELFGLRPGATYSLMLGAMSGKDAGPPTDVLVFNVTGTAPQRVTAITDGGVPVIGGAVTWVSADGKARSTDARGFTSEGVLDITSAPGGDAKVVLDKVQLPDGTFFSGSVPVHFGSGVVRLKIPMSGDGSPLHPVVVTLPGGIPVSGVHVALTGLMAQSGSWVPYPPIASSYEATWQVARIVDSGVTNSRGDFVAVGLGGDFLKITYNDGTADRALPDFLRSVPGNRVELPTAPYVTVPAMKTVATPNAAVPVVVDAWAASSSAGARTVAGSKQTGVQVTLLPPRGAATNVKGQCTAVLTAVTNTSGKATLRVCATKSGTFQVRAKGAMTSGSLTLLVKGKPALPPRSARAKSVRPGAAVVSWVKPFYSGGTDVTGYRIVVSSPGKPTRVNFLKVFNPSTKLAVAFDGLAHAKMYTVQIVAITRYGSSEPVTTTVPVA